MVHIWIGFRLRVIVTSCHDVKQTPFECPDGQGINPDQSIALWAAGLGLENGQYLLRMKGWLSKQTTVSIRGTLWCNRSGTMATCCPEPWAKSVPSMHPIFSSWILVSMSQTRIGNTGLCCQRECFGLKVDAVPLWQTGQEREKTRFHIALELKGNPQNRRCCAICSNW